MVAHVTMAIEYQKKVSTLMAVGLMASISQEKISSALYLPCAVVTDTPCHGTAIIQAIIAVREAASKQANIAALTVSL